MIKAISGKGKSRIAVAAKRNAEDLFSQKKDSVEDASQRQNGVDYFLYLVYTKIGQICETQRDTEKRKRL